MNINIEENEDILNTRQDRIFKFLADFMSFNDDSQGSAIELLMKVNSLYPECSIAFANGGDRTNKNTPEMGFCSAYNIDMLWNIGGGKIQSSSELINKANEYGSQ